MIRVLLVAALACFGLSADAQFFPGPPSFNAFAPLHTYFMAASGCSDANSGTSAGSPWCTPNHAVVCGDVIIAAAGTYNGDFATWGTVSTCPSTSGGIDGTGGIYAAVLLCGGSDLGSSGCNINCSTAACNAGHVGSGGSGAVSAGMNVNKSNWAVEGWTINGNGSGHRAFQVDACLTTSTVIHHNAFINDVAYNTGQGYDADQCGYGSGGAGGDYQAVIGMVAQNAAQDGICLAAIDAVAPGVLDTNAGTHQYFYNDYSYAAHNASCVTSFDTEGFMFDTWSHSSATYQGVIANSIAYSNDRYCIKLTDGTHANAATYKFYNNTCFRNDLNINTDSNDGEFTIYGDGLSAAVTANVASSNNIAYQPLSAPLTGTGNVTAYNLGTLSYSGTYSNNGNVYQANNSTCHATTCDSTNSNESYNTPANLGTNTYTNPSFNNTTDLLSNQTGTPSCTGFVNTTRCMGYNAESRVLTNPSVIYDLQPTAAGTSGKGFQLPSVSCNTNADYPTWLKGIVYLRWDGTRVWQYRDLATVPCGM